MSYVPPGLTTDPGELAAGAKAYLEAQQPGWRSGNTLADLLIDAFSFPMAEQAQATEAQLTEAFRGLGPSIGVVPNEAVSAQATATFTLINPAPAEGFTVPVGTLLGIRDGSGTLVGFRVVTPIVVAEGTREGSGLVEAEEPGTGANNLTGVTTVLDAPAGIEGATLATSGGGRDREDDAVFLARLSEALERLDPGIVVAADAAAAARAVPGITRATAVDNLRPAAADGGEGVEAYPVEKNLTVAVRPDDAGSRAAVHSALAPLRETGFKLWVVAPHYEAIDVSVTVYAWPGQDPATVKAEVVAALEEALSPDHFSTDETGKPTRWAYNAVVHGGDLYRVLGSLTSVRWATNLLFGAHGGVLAGTDHVMHPSSLVPVLPTPGTITVTVELS